MLNFSEANGFGWTAWPLTPQLREMAEAREFVSYGKTVFSCFVTHVDDVVFGMRNPGRNDRSGSRGGSRGGEGGSSSGQLFNFLIF